jgi:alkylation response protein AidB-like acyl-CoA dehydrogenase
MLIEEDPRREAFRAEVRAFLEREWEPDRYLHEIRRLGSVAAGPPAGAWHAKLQEARLVAPHWPERYGGRGLGLPERLIVTEELVRWGAPGPGNPIALGWAGPTLLRFGTETQRTRYLLPMLEGTEIWCQLFSEPDAGSDLAGLSTRAERDGDEFIVSGQKIWSSLAHRAHFGILLARTNAEAPKHQGLTYFIIDMHQPGIEVRPIRQMTGEAEFCEVFLAEARVPADGVVGEIDQGWRVAVGTLMNERMSLSTGLGVLWGGGPPFGRVWERLTSTPVGDPVRRNRLAELYGRHRVLEFMKFRLLSSVVRDEIPGVEAAVQKLLADRFGQDLTAEALRTSPGGGFLWHDPNSDTEWEDAFLFSRALTIGGGTEEIQKNILAERGLGLPSDP